MKKWIRHQFRKKSRVYVFPTRMGGYLNGLVFLMFLLSIGYSNNLLLIFTLILFGFNLLWLVQTHFYLHRLRFDLLSIRPGHAGDPLEVRILWKASPTGALNWDITLESDQGRFGYQKLNDAPEESLGEIRLPQRGVYRWNYLKVKTTRPFGLYQVWIYFPLNFTTLVYPSLLSTVQLGLEGQDMEGELLQDKKGPSDFRGLSQYHNDESRKISWKHYARTGELLIKEGDETKSPLLEVELTLPENKAEREHYLSYVATQLVECHRQDIPFNFKAPGTQTSQLVEGLKVLALC